MKKVDHIVSVFLRQIVLRMKALGLNHTTLAQRLDVSRPSVIKVLHGDVNISFGTAIRFAKALEMDFVPQLVEKRFKDKNYSDTSSYRSSLGED